MKSPAPSLRHRQSGFALLITITLLAFLVLLLVSLATLTRVETQVASNNQQLSQARQNALMALNVALGRLQAAAGPDTRVTATADIVAAHADKKHWTGVWNAAAAGADKNIAWLVSGSPAAGAATVATALPASDVVSLVGENSTDITVAGNEVKVPTEAISSATVPGMTGTQTIGNFAYWIGDEGVKAKVSIGDPWTNVATREATTPDTTADQARLYRFVNTQRMGIEGVDAAEAGTKLNGAYPAFDTAFNDALPKILSLSQLPLAHASASGQSALASAGKVRFHDLTAVSYSVLADVAKGGLKKDLTAWIADTTSNPSESTAADDDYITPGNPADSFKYGLPKWALIRSYATTLNTGAAVAPRQQTPSRQGIYPVMTYARIGYNITCPPGGGIYNTNIMPVVALWNPCNVPIQKSTDDTNTYEVCFKYTPSYTSGGFLRLVIYANAPNPAPDSFNLTTIKMGTKNHGIGTDRQFWRFKVKLSKDLAPGESRLFTISDDGTYGDGTLYASGQSLLSDAALAPNNAVYIPSSTPLTATQMAGAIFWNTEFGPLSPPYFVEVRLEVLLTKPTSSTNPATIDSDLRNNAYQTFLGQGFDWNWETNPKLSIPAANNGVALVYERMELAMSTLPMSYPETYGGSTGTPRWLANLNPQASTFLRYPSSSNAGSTLSYLREHYIQAPNYASPPFVYKGIPNADGTNVSAGTQVSTTGTARNLVLREFQPADVPLFSIGQLQNVNASTINLNPAYPIGNSLANIYVDRTDPNGKSGLLSNDTYPGCPNGEFKFIYDLSYLLNKALWDGYFFSTVPSDPNAFTLDHARDPAYRLPNARHDFYWSAGTANQDDVDELKITGKAAAHLLLNGGFNVNSTSEQAWRALLYSHNGVAADPADATKKNPYSRLTIPADPTQANTAWLGYRILSEAQIDALAKAIVGEVRTRGPFLSLADFVNRRLAGDDTGLKGPLQAAIDATTTGTGSINGGAPFDFNTMPVTDYAPDIKNDAEQKAIYMGGADATAPSASRAAFAPGYLTQADLLSALGPSLSARSDTFRIRAYGDVVNPATGATGGRAWCEAIVQRMPGYMNTSDAATVAPSAATPINQAFGRRFKIVSFRWLSHDEV